MEFDKTKPTAGIEARLLDDYIRENNDGLEDAISRDHKFPTGYGDDAGEHTQVTFNDVLADKPTVSGNKGALYIKTVNDVSELFYEDNGGQEIQLTQDGVLKATSLAHILGLTSSVDELNILDGVTATASEINTTCDGSTARNNHVHSNITITAGTGLSGGGALSASRTISHAAHTGDVTGSTVLTIGSAKVSQAKLKTSTGSISRSSSGGANYTLPGGEYGFWVRHRQTGDVRHTLEIWGSETVASSSYTTTIHMNFLSGTGIVYVSQRYVTSSGEVHWVFVLRDKSTGDIISVWQAPDHPCFGNGGDPDKVQHPFLGYDEETQEIVVINPSKSQVAEMRSRAKGRDLIEVILDDYLMEDAPASEWPEIPVTVGIPEGHDWTNMSESVTPIRKAIPKPSYVQVGRLKLK